MKKNYGFTLTELIVVVTVLAVLAALLVGAYSKQSEMREAARRTHCLSNLKQLDMALGAHCYPPVTNYPDTLSGLNPNDVMPELFLCPCDPDSTLAPSLLAMTDSNCSYRYQPSNWPGTPAGVDLVFDKSIKYHGDGYNVLRTDHSVWWVAATSVPPIGTTVGH